MRAFPPIHSMADAGDQSGKAYVLGVGDRIQIDLFDVPEYSGANGQYQVLVDGSLNLPLVGKLLAEGKTIDQITQELSQRYSRFYKRPNVAVKLLSPRPLKVGIAGEVIRPGVYTISLKAKSEPESSELQYPTLTSVLKLAGGIDQAADIRQIQIRRPTSSGPEIIQVDLWKFLETGDLPQDPTLRDGDSIFVPKATAINLAEVSRVATATFSPETIQVNVVGEVRQPGVVKVPPNTSLNAALLAAGGFDNRRADKSAVELIRLNPDGTVERRKIRVDFAQGINETTNPPLRNNDVIISGRSGSAKLGDRLDGVFGALGSVFPLSNFIRIFFPN